MVKVYVADVSVYDPEKEYQGISNHRAEKVKKYLRQKDKALSIGTELLLNMALSKENIYVPAEYMTGENGKPFIAGNPIYFNLSHSGDMVACVVSDREVGIDIERRSAAKLDVAKRFFHAEEYEAIKNAADKDENFFDFWVLKESYIKMKGLGLQLPLNRFCIRIADKITVEEDGERQRCFFRKTVLDDCHIAVCCDGEEEEVQFYEVDIM